MTFALGNVRKRLSAASVWVVPSRVHSMHSCASCKKNQQVGRSRWKAPGFRHSPESPERLHQRVESAAHKPPLEGSCGSSSGRWVLALVPTRHVALSEAILAGWRTPQPGRLWAGPSRRATGGRNAADPTSSLFRSGIGRHRPASCETKVA